jgi:hypothetical protein
MDFAFILGLEYINFKNILERMGFMKNNNYYSLYIKNVDGNIYIYNNIKIFKN